MARRFIAPNNAATTATGGQYSHTNANGTVVLTPFVTNANRVTQHSCMECHSLPWQERARIGLPQDQPWFNEQGVMEAHNEMLFWGGLAATVITQRILSGPRSSPRPTPNFRAPTNAPQAPPTAVPSGHTVRVMPATEQYPNGYWRLEKPMPQGGAQGINPSTMRPGTQHDTHVPLPPGWTPGG